MTRVVSDCAEGPSVLRLLRRQCGVRARRFREPDVDPSASTAQEIAAALEQGADPNEVTEPELSVPFGAVASTSALAAACTWWWIEGAEYSPVEVAAALLRHGADPGWKPSHPSRHTALWELCAMRYDDQDISPWSTTTVPWSAGRSLGEDDTRDQQRKAFDGVCCELIRLLVRAGASRDEEGSPYPPQPDFGGGGGRMSLVEALINAGASRSVVRCLLTCAERPKQQQQRGKQRQRRTHCSDETDKQSSSGTSIRREDIEWTARRAELHPSIPLSTERPQGDLVWGKSWNFGDQLEDAAAARPDPNARSYWAADDVAMMLRMKDGEGASTLHRAYLTQMLSPEPRIDVLEELLRAGADPSAVDCRGWTADESSAGHPEVMHRFANGYHEYEPGRQAMLNLCESWRGRRELSTLQRLCLAMGMGLAAIRRQRISKRQLQLRLLPAATARLSISVLEMVSADVMEMIVERMPLPGKPACERWASTIGMQQTAEMYRRCASATLTLLPSFATAATSLFYTDDSALLLFGGTLLCVGMIQEKLATRLRPPCASIRASVQGAASGLEQLSSDSTWMLWKCGLGAVGAMATRLYLSARNELGIT